jgi:hypothetical protein
LSVRLQVTISATSGLAFRIAAGATLAGSPLLSSGPVACSQLAQALGSAGLDCEGAAASGSGVTLSGPLFVGTDGTALSLGSIQYMGDAMFDFTEAVYTKKHGLYALDVSADQRVSAALPVEGAMHVSLRGSDAVPTWTCGIDPTFTVAAGGDLLISNLNLQIAGITVDGGLLNLAGCVVAATTHDAGIPTILVRVSAGGSASFADLGLPLAVLDGAQNELSGAGSTLFFSAVVVNLSSPPLAAQAPDVLLTGTIVSAAGGNVFNPGPSTAVTTNPIYLKAGGGKSFDPPGLLAGIPTHFTVLSGPCQIVSAGDYDECVGRPSGYNRLESCEIAVNGAGGTLGSCPVFDLWDNGFYGHDIVATPHGEGTWAMHTLTDCPAGAKLPPGSTVLWSSDDANQGGDHGGHSSSENSVGGGWLVCFQPPCTTSEDVCGVCGGDSSTCAGCDDVANSGAVEDDCGICDGDGSGCCDNDDVTVEWAGGVHDTGTAEFGAQMIQPALHENLQLVVAQPPDGCGGLQNSNLEGKIVLIQRGTCPFVEKTLNAQRAGAVAAIVYNNDPQNPIDKMSGDGSEVTILSILLSQADGAALATAVAKTSALTVSLRCDACINDDSTTSQDGSSTCSSWYDDHPDDCGHYDDGDFDAATQCCMCHQAGEPTNGDDSCRYASDGECDEPTYCAVGTDASDCGGNSAGGNSGNSGCPAGMHTCDTIDRRYNSPEYPTCSDMSDCCCPPEGNSSGGNSANSGHDCPDGMHWVSGAFSGCFEGRR